MTRKNKKYKNTKKAKKLSLKWSLANKVVLVLIMVLAVYYVACTNDLTVKGFVIQEKKLKISELEEKNKKLELAVYKLKNTDNINSRAIDMKMVKVEKIDYISLTPSGMALR